MTGAFIRKLSYGKIKSWYCGLVKRPPPIAPYSHIIQIGDPTLRVVAERVPVNEVQSTTLKFLIKKLKAVHQHYKCVGLSATQIGIPLRVIVVEFNKKHAKPYSTDELKNMKVEYLPQTVIINPEMKVKDFTKIIHSEGCLSIKGYSADVPRYYKVDINGLTESGDHISLNASGWLARIFQHEIDHLNGKLYTDLMDNKTLMCTCWQIVNEKRGKIELPFSS